MSDAQVVRPELASKAPCRPCPVDGCMARSLTADAAGRHLLDEHESSGRWMARPTVANDGVGDGGDELVIFQPREAAAWLQSDCYREVTR